MKRFGSKISSFALINSTLSTFLVGITLRIALALYTSDVGDVQVFYIAIINMMNGIGIYSTFYFTYPPLFPIILFPFFKIFLFFNQFSSLAILQTMDPYSPLLITSPLFNILLKIPIFVFDTLIGFIIYKFLYINVNKDIASKAFKLWYLNPLLIYCGTVNGQFDVIPTFFLFLAFILLYYKRYALAGVNIGFGFAGKLFPLYFLPLYIIVIIKNEQRKIYSMIKFFLGLFSSIGLMFLPFFLTGTWQDLLVSIFERTEYISSLGGLNFFNIFYIPYFNFILSLLNESPFTVNLLLNVSEFILFLIILLLTFIKDDVCIRNLLQSHIKILLVIYLLTLTTNPQYIIWILPFLIMWYSFFYDGLLRIFLICICAIMFNLAWNFPFYPLFYFSKINETFITLMKYFHHIIFCNTIVIASTGLISTFILISFFFLRGNKN